MTGVPSPDPALQPVHCQVYRATNGVLQVNLLCPQPSGEEACQFHPGFKHELIPVTDDAARHLMAELGRALPEPREARLYEAHQQLLKAFDLLARCRCGSLATHLCLDAAGMGLNTCEAHAKPGGMVGGEGPFPLESVRHLKETLALLSEALGAPALAGPSATGRVVKLAREIQRELKKGESSFNIVLEAELDDALMELGYHPDQNPAPKQPPVRETP